MFKLFQPQAFLHLFILAIGEMLVAFFPSPPRVLRRALRIATRPLPPGGWALGEGSNWLVQQIFRTGYHDVPNWFFFPVNKPCL